MEPDVLPAAAPSLSDVASAPEHRLAEGRLLARLQRLQYGPTERILLFPQSPVGLGGQISRRLQGLRLALLCDRKVVSEHLSEPPYGQVFHPLHSPFPFSPEKAAPLEGLEPGTGPPLAVLDFWRMWETPSLRRSLTEFIPPGLERPVYPELYLDGLLLAFCRLTEEHAKHVDSARQRLGVDDRTLGVHLRRGDKSVETPYVPIEDVNEAVAQKLETGMFDSVFLASDDPAASAQITLPKDVRLIFDDTEKRYNNANHRFIRANPGLAGEETRTAVKNIYLLGACSAVVGQWNAHFATLAASLIYFRTGRYDSVLLDPNLGLKRSFSTRIVHRTTQFLRAIAKTVAPELTIRGRTRS